MPYFEIGVGAADAVIAPANAGRLLAILCNPGAVDVYIAFDRPATVGQSFRLPAGGPPVVLKGVFPGLVAGAVHAIAGGAGGRLAGFVDQ